MKNMLIDLTDIFIHKEGVYELVTIQRDDIIKDRRPLDIVYSSPSPVVLTADDVINTDISYIRTLPFVNTLVWIKRWIEVERHASISYGYYQIIENIIRTGIDDLSVQENDIITERLELQLKNQYTHMMARQVINEGVKMDKLPMASDEPIVPKGGFIDDDLFEFDVEKEKFYGNV